MKRKVIITSLAVFFCFMIAATIIAENIYYNSLPVVEAAGITGGKLSVTFYPTGHIVFGRKENVYYSLLDGAAVRFLVKDGQDVKHGDPIFSINKDEVIKAWKQTELSLLFLEKENDKISSDGVLENIEEEKRLTYEINAIDIAMCKNELAALKKLAEDGGVVFAGQNGRFCYTTGDGSAAVKGQSLAMILSDTGERVLEWTMPAANGILFSIGDSAEIEIDVLETVDEETKTVRKVLELPITDIKFLPESQAYAFKAEFPSEIKLNTEDYTSLSIICTYESGESYNFIIPSDAVSVASDGSLEGYVYLVKSRNRVYGEEFYIVETEVRIQRSVGEQTALVSAFNGMDYVVSASKDLRDGMAVRIK